MNERWEILFLNSDLTLDILCNKNSEVNSLNMEHSNR